MPLKREHVEAALSHLRNVDPIMGELIDKAGPFTLKLDQDRFGILVRSILSQQISTSAARAIRLRLEGIVAPDKLSASAVAGLTEQQLRSAGLSSQKMSYLKDLSQQVLSGRLNLRNIGRRSDEDAIEHLIQVRGIGRWTAQMFLIFSLGRLDVFPHDDLIVRSSIQELYRLRKLPDKKRSHEIASLWAPFRSVASWYCWRLVDVKKATMADRNGYPV